MSVAFVLYNSAETMVVGIFETQESLSIAAEKYAEDHDLENNVDLFGYKVKMGEIYPIGANNHKIVKL